MQKIDTCVSEKKTQISEICTTSAHKVKIIRYHDKVMNIVRHIIIEILCSNG